MAQLHIDATVTDGSANVTLPGDVRSEIKPGDYFKLVEVVGVYEIASATLAGSDTEITLTAPYVGDSGTYPALVHRDFTARGYPLIYAGDLDVPDILRRWALQMDGEVTHAEDVAGEAVAAHVAQPDPHPQYTLQSLLNLGKSTTSPATPITGSLLSGAMLAAGAIVEQGTNANGSYWRWESGLQICTHVIPFTGDGVTTYFSADNQNWPAAFAESPLMSVGFNAAWGTSFDIGNRYGQIGFSAYITYYWVGIKLGAPMPNGHIFRLQTIAVGLWK